PVPTQGNRGWVNPDGSLSAALTCRIFPGCGLRHAWCAARDTARPASCPILAELSCPILADVLPDRLQLVCSQLVGSQPVGRLGCAAPSGLAQFLSQVWLLRSADVSVTRMMILGLVRWMQPVHGYDVRRELLSWSADKWANIQPGSIYHALRKLTEEGLL